MTVSRPGIRFALAFLLTALTAFNVLATDVFFDMQNVFGMQQPQATNRQVRMQSLSPFAGSFFYRTSDVAGQFYVSNALATTYSGTVLAPPNSIAFSFYVSATNLGTISAQGITAIPANTVSVFPAGQTAYSAQASDIRYAPSSNGPSGSLSAAQSTNLVQGATNNMTSIVYSNALLFAGTNLVYVTSNALQSAIGSAGASLVQVTNVSSNTVYSATNGYSSIVYSNGSIFVNSNLLYNTSNSLASQIGAAGISAVTATNISTNQVFLGTNGIGVSTGFSAFVSTNRFDTNGAGLTFATAATNAAGVSSGLSAYVSTNRFDTNAAGTAAATLATNGIGIASGLSAMVSTNRFDVSGAAAIKANTNSPTIWTPIVVGNSDFQGAVTAQTFYGSSPFSVDSEGSVQAGQYFTPSGVLEGWPLGWVNVGGGQLLLDRVSNGGLITNISVSAITTNGSSANQVITSVGGVSVWTNGSAISGSITNIYATNAAGIIIAGQRAYVSTNYEMLGSSNFLFTEIANASNTLSLNKMGKTNDFSVGQTASNLITEGNMAFGLSGLSTNIYGNSTNYIAFVNAGSSTTTNGAFIWDTAKGAYTNWLTGSIITNNGSAWLQQTNGVTLYSVAGTSPVGAYAIVSGVLPAPLAVYTAAINDHFINLGYWSVTNLAALSNAIVVNSSNNSIANLIGFGTNTYLTNSVLSWFTPFGGNVANNGATLNFQALSAGLANTNTGSGHGAAILSGESNRVGNAGASTIAGGTWNSTGGGANNWDFIGGGLSNNVGAVDGSAIVGGTFNTNNAGQAFIGGGQLNRINSGGGYAVIVGGLWNSNNAGYGVILGGQSNFTTGTLSMAAGKNALATNDGTFVWAPSGGNSTTNYQAVIAATNGLFIQKGGLTLTNLNPGAATMALGVTDAGTLTTNGVPGGGISLSTITNVSQSISDTTSNLVYGNAQTSINTTSNSLQAQITAGGITAVQATNISQFISNLSSNSVYGNANTAINASSNALQTTVAAQLTITNAFLKWNAGQGTNNNFLNTTNRGTNVIQAASIASFQIYSNSYDPGDGAKVALTVSNVDATSIFHVGNSAWFDQDLNVMAGISGNGAALTSLNGANITTGTIPLSAINSGFTNILNFTNGPPVAGQAVVIVGTNAQGGVLMKGTNWPTGGGGSQTPWASTINGAENNLYAAKTISLTNAIVETFVTLSNAYNPDYGYGLSIRGWAGNADAPQNLYVGYGVIGGRAWITNGDLTVTNAGVSTIITSNNVSSSSANITGGITNSGLTASTVLKSDANKKLASVANAAGALTNDGSGGVGWLSLASLGGGTSLPTNGFDGQAYVRGPGGVIQQTNVGSPLGYGPLTNNTAFYLYGDSRAKSDNSGSTTIQSYLTNTYLVGSQWRFITNGGIGGQTVATMQAAFPAFINDYKATTAAASGTNNIVINLCGINDIVNFVGGAVVASNYIRLMALEQASNCIPVAVLTSPAYALTDTQLANLKIFNDLVFASTNWAYVVPANFLIPPPPQAGMWADNIHNNSFGNDRLAFYINQSFLCGQRNLVWFSGYSSTPSGQLNGSAADSTGQASSIFGVGSTTAMHVVSSSGANAYGITAFSDTIYSEWNSASGSLNFTAANLRFAQTPTNTFFYGISAATNMAGVATVVPSGLNTIALNQRWTNNFVQRADLVLDVLFGDAATGDPVLHFTNSVTGESYTNGPRFGLTATVPMTLNFIGISPGDFGSFSNYSGTGATITIVKAKWKLE